jgi:hypothetical protein
MNKGGREVSRVADGMSVCVCLIGFYVTCTPTQYRTYGDVPASLVEEDLGRPSVH